MRHIAALSLALVGAAPAAALPSFAAPVQGAPLGEPSAAGPVSQGAAAVNAVGDAVAAGTVVIGVGQNARLSQYVLRYRLGRLGAFTPALAIGTVAKGQSPTATINASGEALVTWWADGAVHWARHLHTGAWTQGLVAAAPEAPYRFALALAPTGRSYLAWAVPPAAADHPELGSGDWTIRFLTRGTGTGAWTAAGVDSVVVGNPPLLDVTVRGDVLVALCGQAGPVDAEVFAPPADRLIVRRRLAGTRSWTTHDRTPSSLGCPRSAALGVNGDAAVGLEGQGESTSYSPSLIGQRRGAVVRWDRAGTIAVEDPANSAREGHLGAQVSVSPNGSVVAAWYANTEDGAVLTVARRSPGAAGSWGTPTELRTDLTLPTVVAVSAGDQYARVAWWNASIPVQVRGMFAQERPTDPWRTNSYAPGLRNPLLAFAPGGNVLAAGPWLLTQDFS